MDHLKEQAVPCPRNIEKEEAEGIAIEVAEQMLQRFEADDAMHWLIIVKQYFQKHFENTIELADENIGFQKNLIEQSRSHLDNI